MDNPLPLFVYYVLFKQHFTEETLGFSGIRTRIARIKDEYDAHWAIAMALDIILSQQIF